MNKTTHQWRTPSGRIYNLYADMARQPHLLIAGATGSGKSVVERGIIHSLLFHSPARVQMILIDPKRVELVQYKGLPHVIAYAADPSERLQALQAAVDIMEQRYTAMARQGLRMYTGPDLYVIIDELADIMTTQKKAAVPLIQRLAQLGRASKIHLIACTQSPLRSVIPTEIACNLDARVGLRTRNAQDSRNILQQTGCEQLPRYGQGYYMTPEGTNKWAMPYVDEAELDRLVTWWTSRDCVA